MSNIKLDRLNHNFVTITFICIFAFFFINVTNAQTLSTSKIQTLRIVVNKASILKLTKTPATIIIGNPALADVTPQDNNVLVLVGKASGRTNIIILDANGNTLYNYDIAIQEEQAGNLTMFKGGRQWTYSCAPFCERVINPNDDEEAFKVASQVVLKTAIMETAAKTASVDTEIISAAEPSGEPTDAGQSPESFESFVILPPQN